MAMGIAAFQSLIKDHSGLDFEGDTADRLGAALQLRMESLAYLDPAVYYERLHVDAVELQTLINTLTVNETYFMREPAQLDWLARKHIPRILAARGDDAGVRILSAGCSSGEEPYSIAMALIDALGDRALRQCVVTGVDIDTDVLKKAATGIYTAFSFRGVPNDMRARHFQQHGAAWAVNDDVRSLVRFQSFNVLNRSAPAELLEFDIVLFRNVSIYFDVPTRKTIQANLSTLMRTDGILLTSAAETLANDLGMLHLREDDGLFYFSVDAPVARKQTRAFAPVKRESTVVEPKPKQRQAAASQPVTHRQTDAAAPNMESIRAEVQAKAFEPAHQQLTALLLGQPDNVEAMLLMAFVLLNRKDFAEATALALRVLEVHTWSVDALYLLGHIHRWQQQNDAAIDGFKRAVYACPTCWPAHYYLSGLYREKGSVELARRSLRAVQNLVGQGAAAGLKYVPIELPSNEMRHLCERQLANLVTLAGEHKGAPNGFGR